MKVLIVKIIWGMLVQIIHVKTKVIVKTQMEATNADARMDILEQIVRSTMVFVSTTILASTMENVQTKREQDLS